MKKQKVKKKENYYLEVSFKHSDWEEVEKEVEKCIGMSSGSGYGFGIRDLTYWYKDVKSLKKDVKKVRKLPRKIKCRAWKVADDFEYDDQKISLKGV